MDKQFANDIIEGLSSKQKYLYSKYFYDDIGSKIFQEIMNMPDYYPTDCELEILSFQGGRIIEAVNFNEPFNIVELGAGDGSKTFKFLKYLVQNEINFYYIPIDISQGAMDSLTKKLKQELPSLEIHPRVGDYFKVLQSENLQTEIPSLLLFLGGNIGNYNPGDTQNLMSLFYDSMKKDDKLLVGFDLRKNPITIHNAYYDKYGITKRFNLNLLVRINREFEGDFKLDNFDFYCTYNPLNGNVKSYIVSLRKQTVYLKKLDRHFYFNCDECIWTELSKKYSFDEIEALARATNFEVENHFLDGKKYFSDSLLSK